MAPLWQPPRRSYLVVDALTNATKAGDSGNMEEARRTLMDAMRQVETSSTAKEEMGKALMEDLKVRIDCPYVWSFHTCAALTYESAVLTCAALTRNGTQQAMGQMRTAGEYKSSGHAVVRMRW
mmetsp:Transcript_74936/g.201031  ORF Transcript_74936/g.201031 Transcript_74936/m.201031 type:complete len:123 (-) Transcript_74936:627-995(-)